MDPEVTTTQEEQTHPDQPTPEQQAAAEEAFLAGFEGRATEPPPPPSEVQQQEPAPPASRYRQITEDEFAALNAAAARLEQLQATVEKSNGTAFGKIGGIERRLQEMGAQAIKLPKDKVDRLRADLPEIAELFDELQVIPPTPVDADALVTRVREQIKPDELMAQAEDRAWQRFARARASEIHEDWETVANSVEFAQFAKSKGSEYEHKLARASEGWDYRVITGAITDFKEAKRKAAANVDARRARIDSNVTPRGTPAPLATGKSPEDEFNEGFEMSRNGR